MDQITELHKKELAVLRKTHAVKLDMLEKKHVMRRKNFRNTILAEERKVRTVCFPTVCMYYCNTMFDLSLGAYAMSKASIAAVA